MHTSATSAWRVLQYPVGLIVAAVVSVFAALMLLSASIPLSLMHASVGFLGVFLASFCFLRSSRLLGSVFLLVAGVTFVYIRFVWFETGPGSIPDGWIRLAFIGLGAIIAVISHAAWHLLYRRDRHEKTA
jgi:hypothetical protein